MHGEIYYQNQTAAYFGRNKISGNPVQPQFYFFPVKPKSIEEQLAFLRQNPKKRKEKSEFNFSIMCDGVLAGAIGVKIDTHRPYIGEIGFFVE